MEKKHGASEYDVNLGAVKSQSMGRFVHKMSTKKEPIQKDMVVFQPSFFSGEFGILLLIFQRRYILRCILGATGPQNASSDQDDMRCLVFFWISTMNFHLPRLLGEAQQLRSNHGKLGKKSCVDIWSLKNGGHYPP